MDIMSTTKDASPGVNARIAARARELRARLRLSLDALAEKSGVSRSMISLIERAETSPTAVVLEKLAAGLEVTMASLFEAPPGPGRGRGPLARLEDQQEWRDPASGYVRRNVSPVLPEGALQPMQIVEVRFPPGARVAFENAARDERVHQQVWMLENAMDVTVGEDRHGLREGDCLAMELDRPTLFHNPTRRTSRYAVVIARASSSRR